MKSARLDATVLGSDEWVVTPYLEGQQIFSEDDRLATTHPVYVIPQHKADDIRDYLANKAGF